MSIRSTLALALTSSVLLGGPAMAAEKAAVKDAVKEAVKDPKAAAQKVIQKQVTKEAGSAAATAAAPKAFQKVSQELYPKAKQEGNLIVYSVWDVEHLKVITDAFMKRYPGIKATYWQGRNPEIVTRVLTEFQGGQASFDVVLSDNAPPVIRAAGGDHAYETVQKDVLYLHDPTPADSEPANPSTGVQYEKNEAGRFAEELGRSLQPEVQRHDRAGRSDAGRTAELDALGIENSVERRCRYNNFLKGLKALNVPVHKSTSAMFRLVISGEYNRSVCRRCCMTSWKSCIKARRSAT